MGMGLKYEVNEHMVAMAGFHPGGAECELASTGCEQFCQCGCLESMFHVNPAISGSLPEVGCSTSFRSGHLISQRPDILFLHTCNKESCLQGLDRHYVEVLHRTASVLLRRVLPTCTCLLMMTALPWCSRREQLPLLHDGNTQKCISAAAGGCGGRSRRSAARCAQPGDRLARPHVPAVAPAAGQASVTIEILKRNKQSTAQQLLPDLTKGCNIQMHTCRGL